MVTGTIVMLVVLDRRLSLIVIFFLLLMFLFILYSSRSSKKYFAQQQAHLAALNGFVEEMVAGQKVEKVFNHEDADFETFCRYNEDLRQSGTRAGALCGDDGSHRGEPQLLQLRCVCLPGRDLRPYRTDGSGQSLPLSGLCPAERHAH